jgi:hypothetical protein
VKRGEGREGAESGGVWGEQRAPPRRGGVECKEGGSV